MHGQDNEHEHKKHRIFVCSKIDEGKKRSEKQAEKNSTLETQVWTMNYARA